MVYRCKIVPFDDRLKVRFSDFTHINMTVHIKYFASLRETIGRDSDELTVNDSMTVENIWQLATNNMPPPEQLLVAVNQEYANFEKEVKDGDEVAFFPPVTGG